MNKSKSKSKKIKNLRHAEYYDMQDKFDELFAQSASGETFDRLMQLILSQENILLAYRNMKRNVGSVTPGTDGLTIKNLEKLTPDKMVQKIRNITKNYTPRVVRRKEIPKPYDPKRTRPLGIPCIWDRLIQQCILQVLEPICEAQFNDNSYGFRPNRSCENAIAMTYRHMQISNLQYVVEVDIEGFFDNVNHSKLIKQMWAMGIQDTTLIYVIKRILKAPIQLENGTIVNPDKGTPQGGIISPLLANIVLNELDKWIESQWDKHPITEKYVIRKMYNGFLDRGNGYRVMKKTQLKEMHIVRYADDFRIFCRNREDATKTMIAVKQWLNERLHLKVSEEKSRVINLKKQYSEFLGIKMRLYQKGEKLVVQSRVCDKAMKRIYKVAKEKMRAIRRPLGGKTENYAIMDYNAFVMGVHNYYQMATGVIIDFSKIAVHISKVSKHLGKRLRVTSKSEIKNAITERYGSSAQIRWISNQPIAPIGYVQTKAPMCKKRSIQKYTPKGRKEIHENLGINVKMINSLLRQKLYGQSTEFSDNRLSLYCAQYGKCAVTGEPFKDVNNIYCHHKIPKENGGKDNYQNLVLVIEKVHILIHATNESTITKYVDLLCLDKKQLKKLNKFRQMAGNTPVIV